MALVRYTTLLRTALRRPMLFTFRPAIETRSRRKLSTTISRRSQEWQQEGIPGSNLPFGIGCKYKNTVGLFLFACSGLNVPFILVRFKIFNANFEPSDPGTQDPSQTICFNTGGDSADEVLEEPQETDDEPESGYVTCPQPTS